MNSKKIFIYTLLLILYTQSVHAVPSYYEEYIDTYASLAIEQQELYGIPASITLAQGILESGGGRSTLALEGNNHFGIKCHSEWTGPSMLRNDDRPNECFRVYDSPEESFRDHSIFLSKKRYASLFELEITDYAGWALGLKRCGYATDPNYAARLITVIEKYGLYAYDTPSGRAGDPTVAFIRESLAGSHPVRKSRGLHYVVATPGDTYESIAKEFNMNAKKLRSYNDADKSHEIKAWEEVYLQEKLETAPEGVKKVTIGEGESIHSVAQRYGVKLAVLMERNSNAEDRPGTTLRMP